MAARVPSSTTFGYALYRDLLAADCRVNGLEVWAQPRALAGRSATMTQRP
jgi:hypothetical protein